MGGNSSKASDSTQFSHPQTVGSSNDAADGSMDMNKALNAVAAQVYDNVHAQLGELQVAQLEKTAELAKDVRRRMEPVIAASGSSPSICQSESSAVIACLKNAVQTVQCTEAIDNFSRCSSAAATK
jgi:hypothetical protein